MLQLIRNKVTGFIAWFVFIFIALAFTLWGANGFIFSKGSNDVAAKVAGHKIPWIAIDRLVQRQIQSMPDQHVSINQLRAKVREAFVDDYAFSLQLKKKGFVVNDSAVVSSIFSQPQFFENGKFSQQRYSNLLAQNGLSDAQYQSQLRDALMEQQPRVGMLFTSFMLDGEAESLFSLFNQTRDANYALISPDKFVAKEVSDESIESYYNAHKQDFMIPEQLTIDYISIEPSSVADNVVVTDEKLENYYSNHTSDYSTPEMVRVKHIFVKSPEGSNSRTSGEAEEKANDILAKLKLKEASFDELLEKYSDDNSGSNGDLGWIRRGEVDPSFEESAFALNKVGEQSDKVVKSPFGFHVLQLTERRDAIARDFSEVKDEIKSRFIEETSQSMVYDLVDEVANIAFENQHSSMDVVAEASGLELKSITVDSGYDFLAKGSIKKELLSEGGLKDSRIISEPLKVSDNHYVVIKVTDVVPTQIKSLDLVREDIIASLQSEDLESQVKDYANSVMDSFKTDSEPFRILSEKSIEWKPVSGLTRDSRDMPSEISESIFSVSQFSEQKVHGKYLDSGEYLVFNVTSVTPGKFDETEDNKEKILKTMSTNMGQLEYELYRDSLINSTKIKLYD